ncbi:MAG: uL15m family ribosomal protein [Candidatus Kariarchaeaceae archaeon]
MVRRRQKKKIRQRGTRSHGWGVTKDHKGAGMRGGKGNAGTMGHLGIQVILREKAGEKVIGKYGFKRPQKRQYSDKTHPTINVSHLDQSIDNLVSKGVASMEGSTYNVNLTSMGITKLLAQGDITRAINITVAKASERAVSKVEEAGGSVTIVEE